MIKLIIDRLPSFIQKYSLNDQNILKYFLETIVFFEEAEKRRNKLINRFNIYNNQLYGTDSYLKTPFLWFTESFFELAAIILNATDFRAGSFYEYLTTGLQGRNTMAGVFKLIQKKTPLTSHLWNELQASCHKLKVPLKMNELQIIKSIGEKLAKSGFSFWDQTQILNYLSNDSSSFDLPFQKLTNFLSLLQCRWILLFQTKAFGLKRIFIHIKIKEGHDLNEIIEFKSEENTVLAMSNIFRINKNPDSILGIIYIPIKESPAFQKLLQIWEESGLLELQSFSRLSTHRRSVSYQGYQTEKGWKKPRISEIAEILKYFKENRSNNKFNSIQPLIITPPFNSDWNFSQHTFPNQIIDLYSNVTSDYTFNDLPITKFQNSKKDSLSLSDMGLLRHISDKGVVLPFFISWRMIYDYSLDFYCIILPQMPIVNLKTFLSLIPYCEINFGDNKIILFAYLTEKLASQIIQKTPFLIYKIYFHHFPSSCNQKWFERGKKKWKTPEILVRN
jgi:hypothetical protein